MIRKVFSDLPHFKSLTLQAGLNVLLAEKSVGATSRQTRNGAGKTSLIELVHFLTGANCDKDSIFRSDALIEATFGMTFELGGQPVTVRRSAKKAADVMVEGDFSRWPIPPRRKSGRYVISNTNWRTLLGALMFNLPSDDDDDDEDGVGVHPTFRSLIAYFVRRERRGGFQTATKQHALQQTGDQQMALSFLLGLDWSIAREWEQVREREKGLGQLKRAYGEGTLGAVIEPLATLRTNLAVSEDRARRLRYSMGTFRVLEQYHQMEEEASALTGRLAALSDGNTLDRQYLAELQAAVADEAPPIQTDLERLYQEAGVSLPGSVTRRFEEVKVFHESVIRNRRSYLTSEIEATQKRIADREVEKTQLDERRSVVMSMLQSHGALDQFTALQVELARLESETETLRQKFRSAEALEASQVQLKAERTRLRERLNQDYREQGSTLSHAIVSFEEISRALYEHSGSLTISAGDNGPVFDIHIAGELSKGINNMQIFCFDMMLMRLCAERQLGPGFLIHDSHLFDGVDGRQAGKALAVGAGLASRLGFQYFVTMNSDAVPSELPEGFNVQPYILPVSLTDATEDGGLFGLRFR
jgi:uncharacterized protein YydD (DUF2326 family)